MDLVFIVIAFFYDRFDITGDIAPCGSLFLCLFYEILPVAFCLLILIIYISGQNQRSLVAVIPDLGQHALFGHLFQIIQDLVPGSAGLVGQFFNGDIFIISDDPGIFIVLFDQFAFFAGHDIAGQRSAEDQRAQRRADGHASQLKAQADDSEDRRQCHACGHSQNTRDLSARTGHPADPFRHKGGDSLLLSFRPGRLSVRGIRAGSSSDITISFFIYASVCIIPDDGSEGFIDGPAEVTVIITVDRFSDCSQNIRPDICQIVHDFFRIQLNTSLPSGIRKFRRGPAGIRSNCIVNHRKKQRTVWE